MVPDELTMTSIRSLSSTVGTLTLPRSAFLYNPSGSARTITATVDSTLLFSGLKTTDMVANSKLVGFLVEVNLGTELEPEWVAESDIRRIPASSVDFVGGTAKNNLSLTSVTGVGTGGRVDVTFAANDLTYLLNTITVDIAGSDYRTRDRVAVPFSTPLVSTIGEEVVRISEIHFAITAVQLADASFSYSLAARSMTPFRVLQVLYNVATAADFYTFEPISETTL